MKKYVSYCRVSTLKQGESGLGMDAQKAVIEHFAKDGEIIASYFDVMSGKSLAKREQLQKAIAHCKKEDAILIVAKSDRLSRNVQDALSVLDDLGEGNVVCCDCPNSDRFTLTIIFAVAERERELISIRTKAALEQSKKRGTILGRARGYKHSAETKAKIGKSLRKGSATFNQISLTIARQGRDKGQSYSQIAEGLNSVGSKTPFGKKWSAPMVRKMLIQSEPQIKNGIDLESKKQ